MNLFATILLLPLFCIQISAAAAAEAQSQSKRGPVIDLDSRNFDSSLRDGNKWLIEFYAPWCGHCKRFAPTYEKVAETLHSKHASAGANGRKVMVAKVDGAADRALSSRFGIAGYPSFFLVDGWNVYEFDGHRTLEEMVDWATEDYVDYEPIPFLSSPFGPLGQLRAMFMLVGMKAIHSYEWLVDDKGFSEPIAAMIMCITGITIGLVSIIIIGLLSVSKAKED